MSPQTLQNILASIAYSAVGTAIFIVAYKLMERILPFDLDKERSEDHNTAGGILIGSIMIGLAIIIAASIH
jgi:uncharacterized membrane protein YjfL (UPF0719 family)